MASISRSVPGWELLTTLISIAPLESSLGFSKSTT